MTYEIYILRKNEFEKFLNKLDNDGQARLARDITFLKENGSSLKMPMAKKIDKRLWELKTAIKRLTKI